MAHEVHKGGVRQKCHIEEECEHGIAVRLIDHIPDAGGHDCTGEEKKELRIGADRVQGPEEVQEPGFIPGVGRPRRQVSVPVLERIHSDRVASQAGERE